MIVLPVNLCQKMVKFFNPLIINSFQMWLASEIEKLSALYSKIEDPEIETVLKTKDLECIEDLSSTELAALRNYLFVPKVNFIY